ncbi:hypothetical protein GE09DRAFT_1262892 [Coniochaeta sp. 2T2.1]|nr:hypothetical protein GE09DRAFT_1262892 [Coniochaeta sp. 2T2.1]
MAFNTEDAPLCLEIGTGAIRGLQVAVSRHGLRALRILYESSPPSLWLGDPSESWTGIVQGSDLGKPMLLDDITTNRDRTFHLGCTTIRQENWAEDIKCTRVSSSSKSSVRITGLVVDAISGNDRPFRDIGIPEEEDHLLSSSHSAAIGSSGLPQYPRWDEELAYHCFFRDYYSDEQTSFMTTASLLDVSRITLQQLPGVRRRRTVGLRIEHHDGTLDTLGEWDPEYPSSSAALVFYDAAFGPLEELVFTLRRGGDAGCSRVVAVSAKAAEEPPPLHYAAWNGSSSPGPAGPKVVVRSNDRGIDFHLEYDASASDTVLAYAFTFAGELEEDNWYNKVWCFESDPQTGPPPQGGPEELEILI